MWNLKISEAIIRAFQVDPASRAFEMDDNRPKVESDAIRDALRQAGRAKLEAFKAKRSARPHITATAEGVSFRKV